MRKRRGSRAQLLEVLVIFSLSSLRKGLRVNFVAIPENEHGVIPRSHSVEGAIHINTAHPDFTARLKSRLGRPIITERLASYLAAILSGHYHLEARLFFLMRDSHHL